MKRKPAFLGNGTVLQEREPVGSGEERNSAGSGRRTGTLPQRENPPVAGFLYRPFASFRSQTKKTTHHFGVLFFGDPYGTRTHVTAVKGRCLNHLTNGPGVVPGGSPPKTMVAATGFEPVTLRV